MNEKNRRRTRGGESRMRTEEYWKDKEKEFEASDPQNPDYSMMEWDCYIFHGYGITPEERFRESVRKNLKTGLFEVYRHHWFKQGSWNDDPWDEVIFTSRNLKDAWEYAERDRDEMLHSRQNNTQKKFYGVGHCKRCGRKLTDPKSVMRGYGPKCWEKMQGIRGV
ncbi:MAG: DUF6011 domain-containing protein [Thermoplasmata archaeon]|jgi:hypothetical protein